jgi:ABC-type transport system involved in multi-copper enzyme maturation permease subunit
MFNKLAAIVGNTFVETVRQPIYGVLMWAAFGLLVINPSIAAFSLESGSDTKILTDIALSTMLLFGLFASVFSASGVITREIESFTVLTVVSKPVSRPLFLIGKYLGVAGAMLVAYYFLTLVTVMTVRHGVMETSADHYDKPVLVFSAIALALALLVAAFGNYVYGWHFSATLTGWILPLGTMAVLAMLFFDRDWKLQGFLTDFGNLQIPFAIAGIFLAVMVLAAIAVALSTRFSQVMTLTICAGVFLLGLLSDYYFGPGRNSGLLVELLYAAVPNFQYFWFADALTQENPISGGHLANVAAYAGMYILATLSVGIAMFQTREIG